MGLGRGWARIGIQSKYSKALVRAEWGWGGVGHASVRVGPSRAE